MEMPVFSLVAIAYALFGGTLSAFYIHCERLRREPPVHVLTLILTFFATALTALALSSDVYHSILSGGARFFAFLGAALCYVPCFIFLGVHYSGIILQRILVPGSRAAAPETPRTPKEWWDLLRATLDGLSEEPNNVRLRLRLASIYRRLGYHDSAAYEYSKAAKWIGRGYAHGHVLYKAAYTLAEEKGDLSKAVPILRRIVRLYPKSYFAAYARRVINRYDAHRGRVPGRREETKRKPM